MPVIPVLCRGGRAPAAGRPDDELEQAAVALEDARDEAAALAAENRALRAALAEAGARFARREAAAEGARRGFEAAMAGLAAEKAEGEAAGEELRTALEELGAVAEELEDANFKLACLNEELGEEVAARTAELADANAMLRESEGHLRLMFDAATDHAIFALDRGGRVSEWNAGAERLLGFAAEEVFGRRPDAMWTPGDLAARAPEAEMREAAESGRAAADRWHLRHDGTRFRAAVVVTPLRDGAGELRGFLKVLRDRTADWAARAGGASGRG